MVVKGNRSWLLVTGSGAGGGGGGGGGGAHGIRSTGKIKSFERRSSNGQVESASIIRGKNCLLTPHACGARGPGQGGGARMEGPEAYLQSLQLRGPAAFQQRSLRRVQLCLVVGAVCERGARREPGSGGWGGGVGGRARLRQPRGVSSAAAPLEALASETLVHSTKVSSTPRRAAPRRAGAAPGQPSCTKRMICVLMATLSPALFVF